MIQLKHQTRGTSDIWACNCGCGFDNHDPYLEDHLRTLANIIEHLYKAERVEIIIHSCCDCVDNTKRSKTSQHLKGLACDLHVMVYFSSALHPPENKPPIRLIASEIAPLAECIEAFKTGGIGLYNWGCHLDIRVDGPSRWDERS